MRRARQDRLIIYPELPVPAPSCPIVNSVAGGRPAEGRTVINLGFEKIYACTRILFEIYALPGPRPCIMQPSQLRVSHASPGLRDRPCGWWKSNVASIRFELMTQQDGRRPCAKMRKRLCYKAERCGCYSRMAWIRDKCE